MATTNLFRQLPKLTLWIDAVSQVQTLSRRENLLKGSILLQLVTDVDCNSSEWHASGCNTFVNSGASSRHPGANVELRTNRTLGDEPKTFRNCASSGPGLKKGSWAGGMSAERAGRNKAFSC